jgi:hypothetical protein
MTTAMGHNARADSYAELTERLFCEFECMHGLLMITQVVRSCRAELQGSPPPVMLQRLETLARERLAAQPTFTFPGVDQDGDD